MSKRHFLKSALAIAIAATLPVSTAPTLMPMLVPITLSHMRSDTIGRYDRVRLVTYD